MFGRNSWTDRLKEKLAEYIDEQFIEYRERLANDLARGVGALAILAVKWTLFLLLIFFGAILISFLTAEILRPFVGSWAYVTGFGAVLFLLGVFLLWMSQQLPWMEKRVFEDIRTALLEEETVEVVEEQSSKLEPEEEETENTDDSEPRVILNVANPEIEIEKKKKDPFRD